MLFGRVDFIVVSTSKVLGIYLNIDKRLSTICLGMD